MSARAKGGPLGQRKTVASDTLFKDGYSRLAGPKYREKKRERSQPLGESQHLKNTKLTDTVLHQRGQGNQKENREHRVGGGSEKGGLNKQTSLKTTIKKGRICDHLKKGQLGASNSHQVNRGGKKVKAACYPD